jgi:CYTH domain-containing protein
MALEIERKYLLISKPKLQDASPFKIEQGYFQVGKDLVRIRMEYNKYKCECYVTLKRGKGLVREEYEGELEYEAYLVLKKLATKWVKKTRHYICHETPDNDYRSWVIDVFDKPHKGLVLMEVELDKKDQKIEIPKALKPYVVREVTGESKYVNCNLAK